MLPTKETLATRRLAPGWSRWSLVLALITGVAACTAEAPNLKDTRVSADNQAEVYHQIRTGTALTGEELELLQAYLQRQSLPEGQYLPAGKTIGQMIQEQRGYLEGLAAAQGDGGEPLEASGSSDQLEESPAGSPPASRTGGPSAHSPQAQSSPGPPARSGAARNDSPPAAGGPPASVAPAARAVSTPKPAPPRTMVVPSGSTLRIRLEQSVSSRRNSPGDRFQASLDRDLVVDGRVLAPKGSQVVGRVTEAKKSGRVKGRARLSMTLDRLSARGESYSLRTNVLAFAADPSKKSDAKKIGIGAGAGAVIGAIAGGGKGAAIGTAIGAGAGTGAVLVTSGKEVEFRTEQPFEFKLRRDLEIKLP